MDDERIVAEELLLEPIKQGDVDHIAREHVKGFAENPVQKDEVADGDYEIVVSRHLAA